MLNRIMIFAACVICLVNPAQAAGISDEPVFAIRGFTNAYLYWFDIGDLNNDGLPDIVCTQSGSKSNAGHKGYIFLQTTNHTFQADKTNADYVLDLPGGSPLGVGIGNFNDDKLKDIVLVNIGKQPSNNLSFFYGFSQKPFFRTVPDRVIAGRWQQDILVCDFNNKGLDDIVNSSGVCLYQETAENFVEWRFPGGFCGNVPYLPDLDQDGYADLVLPSLDGINIFLHKTNYGGAQKLRKPDMVLGKGEKLFYAAFGDFTGDGKPDIAAGSSEEKAVAIYGRQKDGAFAEAGRITNFPFKPHMIAAGDLNGDGKDDLLVTSSSGEMADVFYQQKGRAKFAGNAAEADLMLDLKGRTPYRKIKIADINKDGLNDVVINCCSELHVFLNKKTGAFPGEHVEIELKNPDFETARPGRPRIPADWQGADGSLIALDETNTYKGKSSLVLKTERTKGAVMISQALPLEYSPNAAYELSFACKTDGRAAAHIEIVDFSAIAKKDRSRGYYPLLKEFLHTDWQEQKIPFVTPAVAGHNLVLRIWASPHYIKDGTIRVDNFKITCLHRYGWKAREWFSELAEQIDDFRYAFLPKLDFVEEDLAGFENGARKRKLAAEARRIREEINRESDLLDQGAAAFKNKLVESIGSRGIKVAGLLFAARQEEMEEKVAALTKRFEGKVVALQTKADEAKGKPAAAKPVYGANWPGSRFHRMACSGVLARGTLPDIYEAMDRTHYTVDWFAHLFQGRGTVVEGGGFRYDETVRQRAGEIMDAAEKNNIVF
ncbi:MAG: VCBS repeat-containing protein [Kiritimatiellae bacterium]|nr:VCBS repeat-containing protein [Kiritimatiellia bacterium]